MRRGNGICLAMAAAVMIANGLQAEEDVTRAIAVIHPTEGNEVSGNVEFLKRENGIRVVAEIRGLKPNELHGFHVHQWGDCSDPKAEKAGGHFNPADEPHGAPHQDERHVGDLGNIRADRNGVARYDRVDEKLRLNGEHSIVGRSVMVHEGADDSETQPTGDAGGRIGCGTIGVANPGDE